MSFPNVTDIATTTIENRSKKVADNVLKNNALLSRLDKRGNVKPFDGGRLIYQELSFAENTNAGWYSGYDTLPTAAADVITSAEFNIKQLAAPVVISGLEMLQNSGEEALLDLMGERITVAESTLMNLLAEACYSDGTGYGGKQLNGLDIAVPVDPTTGTYGGISRSAWTFWRSQIVDMAAAATTTTIQPNMNALWALCVRGAERPDLIMAGSTIWQTYVSSLQSLQRFTSTDASKDLNFVSVKFMDADVVLDGGIGGFAAADTMYFLNTKYIFLRPHKSRNMTTIGPNRRTPINQDAEVVMMGWAGNITSNGSRYQGRLVGS